MNSHCLLILRKWLVWAICRSFSHFAHMSILRSEPYIIRFNIFISHYYIMIMTDMRTVNKPIWRTWQEWLQICKLHWVPLILWSRIIYVWRRYIVALNIVNSMKNPRDFNKLSFAAILFVTIWVIIISNLPYISYVNHCQDIIIDTVDHNVSKILLKIFYIIAITFSLPIQMYPISDTFYHMTFLDQYITLFQERPIWKFRIGAVIGLAFWLILAMVIPSLGTLFNIAGAAFGVLTTILMPIAIYNKAYKDEITSIRWVLHLLLFVVFGILGIIALVVTIIDEVTK